MVADIHFDYRMAIMAMENGADKIRINPGNIGKEDKPKELVDAAFALKEGDISEVITASDGYYIINCLSVNKESVVKEHREELAVERRNKAFQDSYKAWAEKFGVHVSRSLLK